MEKANETAVNLATLVPTPAGVALNVELSVIGLIDPTGTEEIKGRVFSIVGVGGGTGGLDSQERCFIDPQACISTTPGLGLPTK